MIVKWDMSPNLALRSVPNNNGHDLEAKMMATRGIRNHRGQDWSHIRIHRCGAARSSEISRHRRLGVTRRTYARATIVWHILRQHRARNRPMGFAQLRSTMDVILGEIIETQVSV